MILSGNFGYSRGTLVLQTSDSFRPGAALSVRHRAADAGPPLRSAARRAMGGQRTAPCRQHQCHCPGGWPGDGTGLDRTARESQGATARPLAGRGVERVGQPMARAAVAGRPVLHGRRARLFVRPQCTRGRVSAAGGGRQDALRRRPPVRAGALVAGMSKREH